MFLPRNEKRIFENNILENGIKTIYVQDKLSDKTEISVCVNIGSLANPKEYQGLAHFLEHMLFLGSKKYPKEDYYEKVVKQYGGSFNAFTDSFETVYYFSAFHTGINVIMDVFSRFFIDPLFNEDSVNREINAVNSEHEKNITDDNWRQFQMIKNVAIKKHPYNTFPTGNLPSLKKEGLRERMIKFWEDNYVSENINICIISNFDIDKQKKMIQDTFGLIPKKKANKFVLPKPIYDNFNTTYQMKSLADIQKLNYYWEVPNSKEYRYNKLFTVLGDVLVNYSKDSLANHLKIKGYIETINYSYNEAEGSFHLQLSLTKIGLKHLEYIDGTLKYALEKIFKSDWNGILKYYSDIYDINFKNLGKTGNLELSTMLAINLSYYPLQEVYSGIYLIKNFEKDPVQKIQSYFDKSFKVLITNQQIKNPIIDKNYNTEYCVIPDIVSKPLPFQFRINLYNPFLDSSPKVIKNLSSEKPELIKEKTWYGASSKFNESNIKGSYIFSNNSFFNNERNFVLTIIAIDCINFYFNQELFNIASLSYDVKMFSKSYYNSIVLEYDCPNDHSKFIEFVDMSTKMLFNLKVPSQIIKSKIETNKEEIKNSTKLNPSEYSEYYFSKMLKSNSYPDDKLLAELGKITVEDVQKYLSEFLKNSTLTSYFYGNLIRDTIPNVLLLSKYYFNPPVNFPCNRKVKSINIKHPNKSEKSNCVTIYYPIGTFVPLIWLHGFMMELILEPTFYTILRTKKQLGYLVNINFTNFGEEHFLIQKIQSEKKCEEVAKEINSFNSTILQLIKEAKLDEYKTSVENQLKQKETTLSQMYYKYFSEILSRKYLFDRKKIILEKLPQVTTNSLLDFAKNYILENKNKIEFYLNSN